MPRLRLKADKPTAYLLIHVPQGFVAVIYIAARICVLAVQSLPIREYFVLSKVGCIICLERQFLFCSQQTLNKNSTIKLRQGMCFTRSWFFESGRNLGFCFWAFSEL